MCNFLSFCYNASPSKDKFGRFAQLFTFLKSQPPLSPRSPTSFMSHDLSVRNSQKRPFPNCNTCRTLRFNLSLNWFISVSLAKRVLFWLLFSVLNLFQSYRCWVVYAGWYSLNNSSIIYLKILSAFWQFVNLCICLLK